MEKKIISMAANFKNGFKVIPWKDKKCIGKYLLDNNKMIDAQGKLREYAQANFFRN